MLQLQTISLLQFKNYAEQRFNFSERIVSICGRNGMGKTNLLDAIYYCCFTKSYFARSDSQNVQHQASGFRIEAGFLQDGQSRQVVCILRETGRKEVQVDGEVYEKFAQHIGRFPCVIIAPDDTRIIMEGSEERRRYLDALLSQLDPAYLQHLMDYNKVLQQRNGFLKAQAGLPVADTSLLEIYDAQLVKYGQYIFQERQRFMTELLPAVKKFYQHIAGANEVPELQYESQLLQQPFPALLQGLRQKDFMLQRTNGGIHKDDLAIQLAGQPFKNIASQGQRKSLLFALKLAEFETIRAHKGFAPLLLLDDVFEKLDEQRMHNLLDWVCVQNNGQLFITDTHPERVEKHFDDLGLRYQVINLS
ncbi:MAG: DNA replication and repair protein RecF [Candidatus Pseudobacter hemicellulosilyticus]|uniref:DNA replication and repair protein RecF n=1 Tax=Candidatus Pseudobacter hemicellulosilyticus TaxID=3121375 RepID=A0AAJ5WQE0_9BACT|nr:MAG: DNA replication and repair protein RecF [Pseudobacter sp.]